MRHYVTDNLAVQKDDHPLINQVIDQKVTRVLETEGKHALYPDSQFAKSYEVVPANVVDQYETTTSLIQNMNHWYEVGGFKPFKQLKVTYPNTPTRSLKQESTFGDIFDEGDFERGVFIYSPGCCEFSLTTPEFPKLKAIKELVFNQITNYVSSEVVHPFEVIAFSNTPNTNFYYYCEKYGALVHPTKLVDPAPLAIEHEGQLFMVRCSYFDYHPNCGVQPEGVYQVVLETEQGDKTYAGYIDTWMKSRVKHKEDNNEYEFLPIPIVFGIQNIKFNIKQYMPLPRLTHDEMVDYDDFI